MLNSKTCSICKKSKELSEFGKSSVGKQGVKAACKVCIRVSSRAYEIKNKTLIAKKQIAKHLRRSYGLTPVQVDQMKINQNNKCAICELTKPLVVDHCHKTGKVRGLLCRTCNTAIGQLYENPEVIQRAAIYVVQEQL